MIDSKAWLNELFSLKGKVAVVLGGASGIGRELSLAFAQAGATVVPSSRRQNLVEQTAAELAQMGCPTIAVSSDVQMMDSLLNLRLAVLKAFGRIDILLFSSGVNVKTPALKLPESEFQRIIDTNLTGAFRACQVFGEQMISQNSGSIIHIASIAGFRGVLEMPAYNASKAGLISLTESLAFEWAPHRVRVNAIAPGSFRTPMSEKFLKIPGRLEHLLNHIPARRLGELHELSGAAVFLASDAASFVTGETIVIDGGLLLKGI
jgi:NAD(P)-dependent dehydrogenase (short-subunit alcohol dehydrogenase family)